MWMDAPANSSGQKTTTAQITDYHSYLAGIDMISPTTGTALLTIYDSENSSTSGKIIIAEMEVDAGMPSCNHEYTRMVQANRGIYAVLSGSTDGASYIVRYSSG